jgi:Zn-dependent protease/CBS domain-containing protein
MGIPIRLHFTFVVLLIFVIVTGLGGTQSLASYTITIVALFASVLAHEVAHAWVAARYGLKTLEIVMYPIGGVSRMENQPKPSQEFWIALAGPGMNLLLATALAAVAYYRQQLFPPFDLVHPTNANLLERLALANLILAAFNLIPAFPMDGGRMLRAALTGWKGENEATRIAALAGRTLAISMGLYGLFSAPLLVFVAFFVYLGAAQESAAAMGRRLTQGIPVRAAMVSEFHTLTHGSTIRDAANLLLATSQQDFPVVHGPEVLGLLARGALLRAMANQGPDTYVAGVMDREFPRVSPDVDLSEVLPLMARTGACALVMKDEQLHGLLTTENLSQFLLLRRFGMSPSELLAYDGHRVD